MDAVLGFIARWIHEASLSALAAAVVILGLVMLLELRSLARLRRAVDRNLERVFEQLDLLRFENQQLIEAQSYAGTTPLAPAPLRLETAPESGAVSRTPTTESGERLPAGEARLLASLAAARAVKSA